MKLHDKSCMLDAFAVIFGELPELVAEQIGHKGLRGYHSQELIELALLKGYAVTEIQRMPTSQDPETFEVKPVSFVGGNDERFGRHMTGRIGILMGREVFSTKPHAVAFVKSQAYDPSIDYQYPILNKHGRPDDLHFIPHTFLRIDKL